jgi:hypothetical protein
VIAMGRSYYHQHHQVLFRKGCGVDKSLACRPWVRRKWRVRLRLGVAVVVVVEGRQIVKKGRLVEEL